MNSRPSSLTMYLRTIDDTLANRADAVWRASSPIHERQTRPGGSAGGWQHCQAVELNMWRLLHEAHRLDAFSANELYLLSCAACCHDLDRGILGETRAGLPHGALSGRFVVAHSNELGLEPPEAIALDYVISIHAYQGDQYRTELKLLPQVHPLRTGAVDLRRIAVLLKAADVLHADASRVPSIAVDPDDQDGLERDKLLARRCTTGWALQQDGVVVTTYPRTWDEVLAVRRCGEFLHEQEWGPISDELRFMGFPYQLRFDHQGRYLDAAVPETTGNDVPGMYPYCERDASLFAGRDDDVKRLLDLVATYRVSLLIGRSGVGKSSLVRAGLCAHLRSLSDWACVTTRPDPVSGAFYTASDFVDHTTGLHAEFTELCLGAISSKRRLFVALDQFEDVVHPGVRDLSQVGDSIADALRHVPGMRVLVAYRDDVESIMGALWIRLSQSARGFPRHNLQPLTREGAQVALRRLLELRELALDTPVLMDQVLDELTTMTDRDTGLSLGGIHPPFVQMVLDRLCDLARDGIVPYSGFVDLARGGETACERIVADYLEHSVERVRGYGQSPDHARAVLGSLAQSSGRKRWATTAGIILDSRVPGDSVSGLLRALEALRLVRALSDDRWEIAHDLLAVRVSQHFIDGGERRFKLAHEALEARTASYPVHRSILTYEELRDLWVNRDRLPQETLTPDNRAMILRSMLHSDSGEWAQPDLDQLNDPTPFTGDALRAPGWYWLSGLPRDDLVALLYIVAKDSPPAASARSAGCLAAIASEREVGLLRELDDGSDTARGSILYRLEQLEAGDALSCNTMPAVHLPTDSGEPPFKVQLPTGDELLETLQDDLTSTCLETATTAAEVLVESSVSRDRLLDFLEQHQRQMLARPLAVLDWFLFAPAYLQSVCGSRAARKSLSYGRLDDLDGYFYDTDDDDWN